MCDSMIASSENIRYYSICRMDMLRSDGVWGKRAVVEGRKEGQDLDERAWDLSLIHI